MSFVINKIVAGLTSPIGVCLILMAGAALAARMKRRRAAIAATVAAFAWLWFWSTGCAVRLVGAPLDRCETVEVAELPQADAILVLGGGMALRGMTGMPEMTGSADRVWQGARIYMAGKAPRVIVTGAGTVASTIPLLVDFGVPASAIVSYSEPRNTAEEASRIREEFGENAKIILVTSAWHMRRSLLLFRRAGLDVVPCAADYEMSIRSGLPLEPRDFAPSADALMRNSIAVKEWVGYFGYRLLRH